MRKDRIVDEGNMKGDSKDCKRQKLIIRGEK